MSVSISSASTALRGAERKAVSFSASVKTPPRPNRTQGPKPGKRVIPATNSRLPATISWMRTGTRLPGGLADRPEGFAERLFRPDVQRDEPPAGLVHDLPGARLDGDGEADSVSNFYRLVFGPGDLLPGDRNAVGGEELLCLVLVEGASARRRGPSG